MSSNVDLSSRFLCFLQESNRQPWDRQSRALTNEASFTLSLMTSNLGPASLRRRWNFFGVGKIHEYQREGAILSRKSHTWKDCPGSTLVITTDDNVNFCTRSRPYQPEVFAPSGPDLGFGAKNFFFPPHFCSLSSPR